MKVVKLINQNIPIWSMLCGDHALKSVVDNINPKLLSEPDFLNPLENNLRLAVFRDKREWIYQTMVTKNLTMASFAIVKIDVEDELFADFNTCFTDIPMELFVKEHVKAYKKRKGFTIKRPRHETDCIKSKEDVRHLVEDIVGDLENSYSIQEGAKRKLKPRDILNPTLRNEDNLYLATNRAFLMQPKGSAEGSLRVMDGTHRLTAYLIARRGSSDDTNNKCWLPKSLYAFYWKEA